MVYSFLLCGYISLFSITIYKMSTSRNHLVVTWISYLRLHKLMGTVQAWLRRVEKAADCKAWPTTALRRARTGRLGSPQRPFFLELWVLGENQPNLEKTMDILGENHRRFPESGGSWSFSLPQKGPFEGYMAHPQENPVGVGRMGIYHFSNYQSLSIAIFWLERIIFHWWQGLC